MSTAFDRRHWLGLGLHLAAMGGAGRIFAAPRDGAARQDSAAPRDNAAPRDSAFDVIDLKVDGARDLARRATVLVPRDIPPSARVPLLVLLHGLGETTNEEAGVRAWIDRYGLVTSHTRLAHPPVSPETTRGDLTAAHAREINDDLARRPYDGKVVIVCPFTPNIWRLPDPHQALDRYAQWIADVLLPEVRTKTPADASPARTGIDGCSLGGFIGLEIFLRRPELFGAWGGVQSALSEAAAPTLAGRLANAIASAGTRRLHVETSTGDAFLRGNIALSRELKKKKIPHDLAVLPGPHDQPFLREAGTLEMLLWHDRALSGS
jgi:hypothetical protein